MIEFGPAERLLQSLGVTELNEIDLESIAYDQGVMVKYRPLDGCEARIIGKTGGAIITIDSRQNMLRRRFSTAHELGHWHHHRGRIVLCRSEDIGNQSTGSSHREKIADRYAADLLLPRYLFIPRANSFNTSTFQSVEALAAEFSTSITSTAIRLIEYGPDVAMLVCHGRKGRKWFNRPKSIPERWFPRMNLDSDSYAFDLLRTAKRRSGRELVRGDAWFDSHGADQHSLYEDSFKILDDEVLSILVFCDDDALEEA